MTEEGKKPEGRDMHILVVEDDWFALNACNKVLHTLGYSQIDSAKNGKMALDILEGAEEPFDLIILDLNMPEMNGIEFIQAIHDIQYAGSLIIMSGEDEKLMEATFELAANKGIRVLDAIPKPINARYLEKLLLKVHTQ